MSCHTEVATSFIISFSKSHTNHVVLIFSVVVAGIVRTIFLGQVYSSNPDKTWLGFTVIVAGTIEGNLAIICACAPSLRSCFRNFFRNNFSTKSSNTVGSTEYSASKFMHSAQLKGSQSTQSRADWKMSPGYVERMMDVNHEEPGVYACGLGDSTPAATKECKERIAAPMLPLSWLNTAGECSHS
jgi:hypothetical protein